MKKKTLKFHYITLALICQALALSFSFSTPVSALDVENFYFDSFNADYYLSKDESGVSHLKVIETLTAIFPSYRQNKGIVRLIPFTNQNGENITLEKLNSSNLVVLRNGEKEPIWDIEKFDNYFEVSTGTDDYLTGRQTYTFIYEFEKVVTAFEDDSQAWQELYWDTNGTGWHQQFNSLTATIHFSGNLAESWTGNAWCYVGAYGSSNQSRCEIEKSENTIKFSTSRLSPGENLTFDLEFLENTFVIPAKPKSYLLIILLALEIALASLFIFLRLRAKSKLKPLSNLYKSTFVAPEYCPPKDLPIAAAPLVSIKKLPGSSKVATLIDLAVKKKIQLKKLDEKHAKKWQIKLLDLTSLSEQEKIVLKILNGGEELSLEKEIEVKTQKYSPKISSLSEKFTTLTESTLVSQGHLLKKSQASSLSLIFFCLVWFFGFAFLAAFLDDESTLFLAKDVVGATWAPPLIVLVWLATIFIVIIIEKSISKFNQKTESSIKLACYLEGLELYIKMAEADRLKFLQSVDGVDVSHQGIVNLYEKLLPYAILFKQETSWLKNLQKYYDFDDVASPAWYYGTAFVASDLSSFNRFASSSISSGSINPASSSSGSGGGGGGFSGGGGGGGGGGGR